MGMRPSRVLEMWRGSMRTAHGSIPSYTHRKDAEHDESRFQALNNDLVNNLKSWRRENRFKRTAIAAVAAQMNEGQIEALRDAFIELDTNGDGHLSYQEVHEGLTRHSLDIPESLQDILSEISTSAEIADSICYTEFVSAALDRRTFDQEELCWQAFGQLDTDHDGVITEKELLVVLEDDFLEQIADREAIKKMIEENDLNGDGQVDFDEFVAMMRKCGTDAAPKEDDK